MRIFAGTSGFSYAEWKGRFYPEALPDAQMLRFYASRLPTVEINNTFYQMPKPETVAGWRDSTPDAFLFAVKASRRITHQKKLADVAEDVAYLFNVVDALGAKVGPVLFQLPPFLKKDLGVLQAFLAALPAGRRAALEFRHPSWFEDDVYAALTAANVALVGGDLADPATAAQVDALARQLSPATEAEIGELAWAVAHAQVDLIRIRRARHDLLAAALTHLAGSAAEVVADPGAAPIRVPDLAVRLAAMDRYERRARSRRKSGHVEVPT